MRRKDEAWGLDNKRLEGIEDEVKENREARDESVTAHLGLAARGSDLQQGDDHAAAYAAEGGSEGYALVFRPEYGRVRLDVLLALDI